MYCNRAVLAAILAGALISCATKPEPEKPAPQPAAKKSGGPGDDDDRPVTMSGSSLDIAGDDHKGGLAEASDDTLVYPYSSLTGPLTSVNEILYRIKTEANPALGKAVFRRKAGMPLSIVITHGPGASPQQELEISADKQENAAGPQMFPANLKVKSLAGANATLAQYERIGKFIFKHPRKSRKVRAVTLTGVVMESPEGSPGCVPGIAPYSFVCTVNTAAAGDNNDSRLHIKVCRPVNGTCPQAAP
jgi:hypothetical protein